MKENDFSAGDSQKQRDFSFEELNVLWKQYADKVKSENRNSEYTILNREIELTEDYAIKIRLENVILLDQLNAFKVDLLDFLRKNLGNNKIMLETSITEQQEVKKIYTAQDKLNFLLEKYPVVAEMKKRLGLDTDY